MISELKPCPFCGGEAYYSTEHGTSGADHEGDCFFCLLFGVYKRGEEIDDETLERAWNCRHERTCTMEFACYDWHDDGTQPEWTCSECGYVMHDWDRPNYCPGCGRKVVEE